MLLLATAAPRSDYEIHRDALERRRVALAARYRRAPRAERRRLEDEAGALVLEQLSEQILPAWYGTPWAFHGTTAANLFRHVLHQ